jgi:hypothetical protein
MKFYNNYKILILGILISIFGFISCKNTEDEIKKINVEKIHIENFEDEVFSIKASDFKEKDSLLSKKYFPFYQYFIKNIVYLGRETDTANLLLVFINDKDISWVYEETKKIFTEQERKKIEDGIFKLHQHIKFYLPEKPLPKRYVTFISGFNFQIIYPDSSDILAIALDMYLGSNHQVYQWLQWPQYRIKQLQKDFIIADIAKAWLFTHYPMGKYSNLLENMMYYGKIIYAMKKFLPNTHDSIIFSYSKKQLDYCHRYEKNLWAYFVEENRLYDNSPKTLSMYLNDGPFTAAISKECPPRIAMYMAYRIVENYMNKNDVSLDELLKEENAQKILQLSKYKP